MATMAFYGERIREIREELGLTRLDVAIKMRELGLDITPETLGRWEHGTHAPRADALPVLARVLGRSVSYFYLPEKLT